MPNDRKRPFNDDDNKPNKRCKQDNDRIIISVPIHICDQNNNTEMEQNDPSHSDVTDFTSENDSETSNFTISVCSTSDDDDDDEMDDDEIEDADNELIKKQYNMHIETVKSFLDEETYETFVKVQEEIRNTEPTIIEILKEPMRLKDRTKLLLFYEIYSVLTPLTPEWLILREKVNILCKRFKQDFIEYSKCTDEEKQRLKVIEKKLKTYSSYASITTKI